MKLSRKHSTGWLMAVALILGACQNNIVYSHYEHVEVDGWDRHATASFQVPVAKAGTYTVRLHLRANGSFPYTQLMISTQMRTARTDGETAQTVTFDITDSHGNAQGEGLNVFNYETTLTPVEMADADTLTVNVAHAMSRSLLPGITDVGITVARLE